MVFPYTAVELTHLLHADVPQWDEGCGFNLQLAQDFAECAGEVKYCKHSVQMVAGIGTHMDAPLHFVPGGASIEQLALTQLVAPCVVIDVAAKADSAYKVSLADIAAYETRYGVIAPGSFVLFYTGWGRFWENPAQYRNHHQFPTLAEEVGPLLLARNIVGIGIDTLSPDHINTTFPLHRMLLGAGKYIVENIANAHLLPPQGSFTLALPLYMVGSSEAPVRMIGLVPR